MLKINIQSSRKNEKGIALIFSLIFLSLLLILALSFALDSMFDQKAAYNSANASSAGLLAKTQLNQIITLIENSEAKYDSDGKLYSHDLNSANDTDMLIDRFKNDVDTTAGWFSKIQWNYVRNGNAATSPIIGRTAFVVVPDDKLPLDSLVDERVGTTDYPKHNEANYSETRIGKYVSEINVQSAVNSSTAADVMNWKEDTTQPLPRPGFPNGEYTGLWGSYDELITAIKNFDSTFALEDKVEENLSLEINKDREAFWGDKNNDGVWDSGEYFSRFNLTRTDWDKSTHAEDLAFIKEEILMEPDSSGIPTVGMQQWLTTDTNTTKISGLPWIACFGYNDSGSGTVSLTALGNFNSIEDQRAQIAANLKDYCDNDQDSGGNTIIRPTSDVDPATWYNTANIPSFTGNEKTPYINKIAVKVEAYRYHNTSGGTTEFTAKVKATPCVELVNIFPDAFSDAFLKDLSIRIEGTVKFHVTADGFMENYKGQISIDQTYDVDTSWTDLNGGVSYNFLPLSGSSYITVPDGSADPYFSDTSSTIPVKVNVTEVSITKVVLFRKTGNIGYDYVKALKEGTDDVNNPVCEVFHSDADGTGATSCWTGWAVHDPRQNLNTNDWALMKAEKSNDPADVFSITGGDGTSGNPYVGASNVLNSSNGTTGTQIDTVSPDNSYNYCDHEKGVTDPADGNLSTAYIRNAPMESPWELGCIHRGYMWQTLNLKAYRKEKAIKTFSLGTGYHIPGGGKYAEGDANILDQIKMTAEPSSPEKINLRTKSISVLDALFEHVNIGGKFGTVALMHDDGTSTPITASTYRDLVKTKYDNAAEADMRTRASVVSELLISESNDAKQEEIIGKIVNLTKIEALGGSGFTVYILAQTIKDIGGLGSTINIRKYSEDETPGDKDCAIGVFDVDTSNPDSKKHIYFDEITAEQKIKVKGSISGGKVKITSYQYLD